MGTEYKIKGINPADNTAADLYPIKYFLYALDNVKLSTEELKKIEFDDGCQTLLVNIDMLLTISRKYPNTASMYMDKLNRKQLKETFETWWKRNEKKIPIKYRKGIRQNADDLFSELMAIETWTESE